MQGCEKKLSASDEGRAPGQLKVAQEEQTCPIVRNLSESFILFNSSFAVILEIISLTPFNAQRRAVVYVIGHLSLMFSHKVIAKSRDTNTVFELQQKSDNLL